MLPQCSDLSCTGQPLLSCTCKERGCSCPPRLVTAIKCSVFSFFFFQIILFYFFSFFSLSFPLLPAFFPPFLPSFFSLSLFSYFSNRWGLPLLTHRLIRTVRISCIHPGFSPGKSVRELAHFSRCQIGGWIQVWSEARGLFSSHGVQTKACARDRWGGDNVACRRAKHCSWHLSPHHSTRLWRGFRSLRSGIVGTTVRKGSVSYSKDKKCCHHPVVSEVQSPDKQNTHLGKYMWCSHLLLQDTHFNS